MPPGALVLRPSKCPAQSPRSARFPAAPQPYEGLPSRLTNGAGSKAPEPRLGIGELFIGDLGRPGLNAHTPFETV